jgi:hypothetical protein
LAASAEDRSEGEDKRQVAHGAQRSSTIGRAL